METKYYHTKIDMNKLSYKGYIGSVEISEADNCLYGRVLQLPNGIEITYEGVTAEELRNDFIGAIDDYIAMCKEKGIRIISEELVSVL